MNERKYKINEDGRLVKKSTGKPIPNDEPVFIFRAKDRKAVVAIMAYVMVLDDLDQREEVLKSVKLFTEFQRNHPERMGEPTP